MDNGAHPVFCMVSSIKSHRIKSIELSFQNMDVAISRAKTALSCLFCKECVPSTIIYRYLD